MAVFSGATKVQPYTVIELDASVVRADTAQGAITLLGETVSTWKANSITVLDLGGNTLTFRLDSDVASSIPASDGLKIEGVSFTEVYWTNGAGAGTIYIFITWVE